MDNSDQLTKNCELHSLISDDHTEQDLRIIKEFNEYEDPEVRNFVSSILSGNQTKSFVPVAALTEEAGNKIFELTGVNVTGDQVVLDANAVRHIVQRHGKTGKQDQSMSNSDDIARIGYVITNFDEITFNGEVSYNHPDKNGKPAPKIQFVKKIDGTMFVVQTACETKQKRNYVVTAYIKKKQPPNP